MTASPMHRLAIYDLDRTITRVPTWTPFLIHAARTRASWRLLLAPVVIAAMLAYRAGLMSRATLKRVMQALLIGPLSAAEIERVAQSFADRFVTRHIHDAARAQIDADRAEGFRIVVATAAHRFYAAKIAAALGIADVVATEARIAPDGTVLPGIAGANCYGTDKLAMIRAWMTREGIDRADAHVRFYSDHATDAPTLDWADEAIAVNPNPRLLDLAGVRGWPILVWR